MNGVAQWDVYANPSTKLRDEVPFLVDVQSDLLSGLAMRLVMPLALTRVAATALPRGLCPAFVVVGVPVVLLPQEAGAIAATLLKRPVMSLRSESHLLVAALDAVIGGI